jgi:hypothetical protein
MNSELPSQVVQVRPENRMRLTGPLLQAALLVFFAAYPPGCSILEAQELDLPVIGQQEEFPLPHLRWVGIKQNCCPTVGLWLEFYPDSMLLVNDVSVSRMHALNYRITEDSIVATGDTIMRVRYELVLDRLVLYTTDDDVITMSPQSELARPFFGAWLGANETDSSTTSILLQLYANGNANWRRLPRGEVNTGEWARSVRTFTFTWDTDSTRVESLSPPISIPTPDGDSTVADSTAIPPNQWVGYHDPFGNALQFLRAFEGSGSIIFRKIYR